MPLPTRVEYRQRDQRHERARSTVYAACILADFVHGVFASSWSNMLMGDRAQAWPRIHTAAWLRSSPRIVQARNDVVRAFLDGSIDDWLLMIDTDMVFEWEHVEQLLAAAHPTQAPVVGGLCFGGRVDGPMFPTLYRAVGPDEIERMEDFPRGSMVKVSATGAAFLLVHRNVLERMAQPASEGGFGTLRTRDGWQPHPHPWFVDAVHSNGKPYGEDIAFCMRVRKLGYPVYVHTGVEIGHAKVAPLTLDRYDRWRAGDHQEETSHVDARAGDPAGPAAGSVVPVPAVVGGP